MILETAVVGGLILRYCLDVHEAIEENYNVESMTDEEKRGIIEYCFQKYPSLEEAFADAPEWKQDAIVARILADVDSNMRANKPKWWKLTFWWLR